ncbi:MAG: peptidylprolyl isomerase [Alphaproteobacteria bacterium]|nr:peptidylprolyl isomerase [Alphaproteobacteria bacterium]
MRLASMIAALVALALFSAGTARAADPDNTLYIDLKDGRVVIEMYPKLAPKHVAQIKALALAHKYDGVVFHRVIAGFMAQTGDPTGTGSGGMGDTLPAEFNDQPHTRGAVSMARTSDPNSARSQFFIVLKDSPFLDRQYTVWGRVTSGMEFVDKIKKGDPKSGAVTPPPDKMIKVRVANDPKP